MTITPTASPRGFSRSKEPWNFIYSTRSASQHRCLPGALPANRLAVVARRNHLWHRRSTAVSVDVWLHRQPHFALRQNDRPNRRHCRCKFDDIAMASGAVS